MSISTISGASSCTTMASSNQSEISKLHAQEEQPQQGLTQLQDDISGDDSEQAQLQTSTVQQQITQTQRQIQQLQNQSARQPQDRQQVTQAKFNIGDTVNLPDDHLTDITM